MSSEKARDLIILEASVHCVEMVDIVERINRVEPTWNLLGFIMREEPKERTDSITGLPLLGDASRIPHFPNAWFAPSFGFPASIPVPQEHLASLVDPSVFVSRTATIGKGCVIYPNCFIGMKAVLGNRIFCLSNSTINHHDCLEDNVTVCSNVSLAGSVYVEANCYLGQACTVKQHVCIGENSLIGMGAVVTKDVPPDSVMVGNPARRIRERKRE